MAEMYQWASPDVVGHLTLPQLKMYLRGDTKQQPGSTRPANAFKSKAERDAYVEKVREKHRQKEKEAVDGLSDS